MTTLVSGLNSNGCAGRLRIGRGYGELRVKDRCHLGSSFQPGRRRSTLPAGSHIRHGMSGGGTSAEAVGLAGRE